MLRALGDGLDVCVTVTLMDGYVFRGPAFHHSINYRSVVMLGAGPGAGGPAGEDDARCVASPTTSCPGRWEEVRTPSDQELKSTMVLALPLEEVSAKVRKGPPVEDDRISIVRRGPGSSLCAAGQLGEPVPMDDLPEGVPPLDISRFTRF